MKIILGIQVHINLSYLALANEVLNYSVTSYPAYTWLMYAFGEQAETNCKMRLYTRDGMNILLDSMKLLLHI